MAETESTNLSGNTIDWQNRAVELTPNTENTKNTKNNLSQDSVGFVPQSEVTTPIDEARANLGLAIQTQRTIGYGESFRAGANESATLNFFDWLTRPAFTPDDKFNSSKVLQEAAANGAIFTPDESQYLLKATSQDEYDYLLNNVTKHREAESVLSANPKMGLLGSVLTDLPVVLSQIALTGGTGAVAALGQLGAGSLDVLNYYASHQQRVGGAGVGDAIAAVVGLGTGAYAIRTGINAIDLSAVQASKLGRFARGEMTPEAGVTDAAEDAFVRAGTATPAAESANINNIAPDPDIKPTNASTYKYDAEADADSFLNSKSVEATPNSSNSTIDISPEGVSDTVPEPLVLDTFSTTKQFNSKTVKKSAQEVENAKTFKKVPLSKMEDSIVSALDNNTSLASADKAIMRNILVNSIKKAQEIDSVFDLIPDFPNSMTGVKFAKESTFRNYIKGDDIFIRYPKALAGTNEKHSLYDIFNSFDNYEWNAFTHEILHAATARTLLLGKVNKGALSDAQRVAINDVNSTFQHINNAYRRVKSTNLYTPEEKAVIEYGLQSPEEMIATLFNGQPHNNNPFIKFLLNTESRNGKEGVLRELTRKLLRILGVSSDTASGYTDLINSVHDMFAARILKEDALLKGKFFMPNMESTIGLEAREAVFKSMGVDGIRKNPDVANAKWFNNVVRNFNQLISYFDTVTQGGKQELKEFAQKLFTDGTRTSNITQSAADFKRDIQGMLDLRTNYFENAIGDVMSKHFGYSKLSQMFGRKEYMQTYKNVMKEFTEYMHNARDAEIAGRVVEPPRAPYINDLVNAYKESGWARRGFDEARAVDQLSEDAKFSEYYLPRSYSYQKANTFQTQGYTESNFVSLFKQVLEEAYPTLDSQTISNAAKTWYQGVFDLRQGQGSYFSRMVSGSTDEEVLSDLLSHGLTFEESSSIINEFISRKIRKTGTDSGGIGSNPIKNYRSRSDFDLFNKYDVGDGRSLSLSDLIETDALKSMRRYNRQVSGRLGLAHVGYGNLKDLLNDINDLRNSGIVSNPTEWGNRVVEGIDHLLGYQKVTQSRVLLNLGAIGNLVSLGGSAFYAAADFGIATHTFGFTKVLKSMITGGMWKDFDEVLINPKLTAELNDILNGVIKDDIRFRYMHSYAMDGSDLTTSGAFTRFIQSAGSATHYLNLMKFVHSAQVNINSGLIRMHMLRILKGAEAVGAKEYDESFKILKKFGLNSTDAADFQKAVLNNPDGLLPDALQRKLNGIGTRAMDYFVQRGRLGEAPYFADISPVGRVLTGWNRFALVAQNKLLRRAYNDDGAMGVAFMLIHQLPLSLMATATRNTLNGTWDRKDYTTAQFIKDAVTNTTILGLMGVIAQVMENPDTIGQVPALGGIGSVLQGFEQLYRKSTKDGGSELTLNDYMKVAPFLRINPILRGIGTALDQP